MAALKPYQSALLENRDILLRDVRAKEVCPLLYVSGVLSQKEIDDINIGRTPQERTESLLDLLQYKGPAGFHELCVALEDTHPHLAAKLRAKNPQVEVLETKPRDNYPVYTSPRKVRDFEQRENNNNDFYSGKRERDFYPSPERNFQQQEPRREMRGERQQRESSASYDRGRQYSPYITNKQDEGRNYSDSVNGSERNLYRKSVGAVESDDPHLWEKKTIVLEKANSNQGFGIAVSGGRDNPHFKSGDTSIVVSDIVRGSPSDGLLKVNDVIVQVNDVNVEDVVHAVAVQALKDSGNSARLAIKRRKSLSSLSAREGGKVPQTVTLIREEQNKGYGFSLGGSMFIKEIDRNGMVARKGELKPGDIILRVNDRKTEEMSLREAIETVRRSNRLDLLVIKDDNLPPSYSTHSLPAAFRHKSGGRERDMPNGYGEEEPEIPARHYSEEDLPQRPPPPLEREGMPFSEASWKRPNTGERVSGFGDRDDPDYPKAAEVTYTPGGLSSWGRDSPVNDSRYVESTSSSPRSERRDMDSIDRRRYRGDTRLVAFHKSGSLGIQVSGGNKGGIFVAAVKPGSPAYSEGLRHGDQILMANDIDFKDITREEAVLILLSLGDEVNLLCQCREDSEKVSKEAGDSFYIKVHFDFDKMKDNELSFQREDVFHIWDTMHDGVIGSWKAQMVMKTGQETTVGIIPNKSRAEQLAQVQHKVEEKLTPRKGEANYGSLKRSSSRGGTLKKYKFVSSDHLDEESFNSIPRDSKLPAYERVALKKPGFVRPVVLLGPIADITRDKLLQDMPDIFAIPTAFGGFQPTGRSPARSYASRRSISYSYIRTVIDSGKHCLLDITPEEVERLNYAQLYPIVIFLKPPNKQIIKDMRSQHGIGDQSAKMVKKLHDNSLKLEEFYSNMFTAVIPAGSLDNWYSRVKEEIKKQQEDPVWMSEDKFDDQSEIEFRMPSRFSQSYDYDSTLDSPTVRSSVSAQHVDDEHVVFSDRASEVHSEPPRDARVRAAYSEPQLRYPDSDRYEQEEFVPRSRYHDEDFRDGRQGFNEDTLERQRPGYKPSGNLVKLLPSREDPAELRRELKKTRMPDSFDRFDDDAEELRIKRESLRKVEAAPDLLREYDQRVGVPVSNLWAIDSESSQRREQIDRVRESPIESEQKRKESNFDLEKRLEDLESALIPQRRRSVEERKPRPKSESFDRKPRNVVVDYSHPDKQETAVHSSFFPTRQYVTVERPAEPEIRANISDFRVESAPPQREFPLRSASLPREPKYRAEVSIPSRREPKFEAIRPDRPRSGYSAFTPKPFIANSDKPSRDPPTSGPSPITVRPGEPVTHNFRLSGSPRFNRPERGPEPRPTTYRSEYRQKITDLDNADQDEQNIVTSDFGSQDEDTQVVATARGKFTSQGGVLSSPESGVSIVIPEGAIPQGVEQEIYFKVCKDNNFMPPLDSDRGETLLSPLVMCGPHGTQFLKPVELRLPHCASMTPDGWSFALKSSDTPTGQPSEWKNVALQGSRGDQRGDQCQVDSNSVSVLVDHFSAFSLVGRARPHTRGQATKRMLAAVFAPPPRVNDDWPLNLVLMDDTEAAFKDVCNSEAELGRFPFSAFRPVLVHGDASDIRVQLRDLNNNWIARSSCKKYIEFNDSWEAYRHAPCVEFLIRDRNFSPSSSVCVVDVFQEGHDGESAAVSVSTRPRKIGGQKVQYLI
ncbi:tight junction protein ZO-1-like isoform X2 [Montipora foliosa]|uniref:tight junction protein ZO-1-like isoform X2 n=1 Tax=Montipora foliosa TaxID=591990 RepID=UPI0035F1C5FF